MTRVMQLAFIGRQAQTQLSMHDPDLTQLQAFEPEHMTIEGRITTQNDPLGKRQASCLREPVQV